MCAGAPERRAWLQPKPVSGCRVSRLSLTSCGGTTSPTPEESSCSVCLLKVGLLTDPPSRPASLPTPPLQPAEYPELQRIKRELSLLAKLYTLYNSVIDSVSGYYDVLWADLNIEKINTELQDFQNR